MLFYVSSTESGYVVYVVYFGIFYTQVPKPRKKRGFAEVIHLLTGLHQEHRQALLEMRDDQERSFHTLVES